MEEGTAEATAAILFSLVPGKRLTNHGNFRLPPEGQHVLFSKLTKYLPRHNAFWPTAVVGEAGSVIYASASACHSIGPKGVGHGQKALLHGNFFILFQVFRFFFHISKFWI